LQQDGDGNEVYYQRFSPTGAKTGTEIRVNASTAGSQREPAIARLENGTFVIAFASEKGEGNVLMQRFSVSGAKVGDNVRVNTHLPGDQQAPSVAAVSSDRFVILWQSYGQDGSLRGIYGQRYAAAGTRFGVEFRVNETTDQDQERPRLPPGQPAASSGFGTLSCRMARSSASSGKDSRNSLERVAEMRLRHAGSNNR
jgi:hypothetical protein